MSEVKLHTEILTGPFKAFAKLFGAEIAAAGIWLYLKNKQNSDAQDAGRRLPETPTEDPAEAPDTGEEYDAIRAKPPIDADKLGLPAGSEAVPNPDADASAETSADEADSEELPPPDLSTRRGDDPYNFDQPIRNGSYFGVFPDIERKRVLNGSRLPTVEQAAEAAGAERLYLDTLKDVGWDGKTPLTLSLEKKAFRALSKLTHPDNASGTPEENAKLQEQFKLITRWRDHNRAWMIDDTSTPDPKPSDSESPDSGS